MSATFRTTPRQATPAWSANRCSTERPFPAPTCTRCRRGATIRADAAAYEDTLHDFFPDDATFDLVLLGLGDDGHTASLFPTDDWATSSDDALPWVRAVEAPPRYDVRTRLSLTLPAINRAHSAFFLVAGASKHDAATAVLQARDRSLPPTHVRPRQELVWFLDEAARFGKGNR